MSGLQNLKSIFSEGVGNRSQFSKTSIHNDGIDFHIHDHSILDHNLTVWLQ